MSLASLAKKVSITREIFFVSGKQIIHFHFVLYNTRMYALQYSVGGYHCGDKALARLCFGAEDGHPITEFLFVIL